MKKQKNNIKIICYIMLIYIEAQKKIELTHTFVKDKTRSKYTHN